MVARSPYNNGRLLVIVAILILLTSGSAFGSATIVIQIDDAPNVGFNDPTPIAPVGGNPGTTLGQQRLNAFQAAANIWGATLTSSRTITVLASWKPLTCSSSTAILGGAGSVSDFRDFPGAPFPGTWYVGALANKLSNSDLDPANADIVAGFNINLGNPGCLDGTHFYLGLDNNFAADIDLVSVLLHEFGHGLGFQTFTSSETGTQDSGLPTVYDRFLLDTTTGKTWIQMSDAERVASSINARHLVWNGLQVKSAAPTVLQPGTPLLKINSPPVLVGSYSIGEAEFGAAIALPGVTGAVVQALDAADGAGPSTTDGCSPLTNAGAVSGNIALIDRGTCSFVNKVKNAQNAGASAVIVANNQTAFPFTMTGTDPTVTIPSAIVSLSDGTAIKNQLSSGINATLGLDLSVRLGADSFGRMLMNAPNPLQVGSSVGHWDFIAFPDQLMEPGYSDQLTHTVMLPQDLTFSLFRDIGWVLPNSTTVQFSTSNYNANEGDPSVAVTVSRSGDTSGSSTVDFATSNGTAEQRTDYEVASGTLSFAPNEGSKAFNVLLVNDAYVESNESFNVTLSNPNGAALGATAAAKVTIADNDTAQSSSPVPKRFAATLDGPSERPNSTNSTATANGIVLLSAAETTGKVGLLLGRSLSSAISGVHIHGPADSNGTAAIIFPLPTPSPTPLANFQVVPTAQQVADLKAGLHYMNIHTNNFANGEIRGQLRWNPTLEEGFFVRQQYLDFLSRDPDTGGFDYWQSQLSVCQADVQCFRNQATVISNAFFYEAEYQKTGSFVFNLYRAAFGNNQPFPNPDSNPSFPNEEKKYPDYAHFAPDRAQVVGGANLTAGQQALANAFVERPEFIAKYPLSQSLAQFVDAILLNIKTDSVVNLDSLRPQLVALGSRGTVLYRLVNDDLAGGNGGIDNRKFIDAEYNRTFVATQYFGYLRRNGDIGGLVFWLGQVNSGPLRDGLKQNGMVCSFITSDEYQKRFGPVAPRNNTECPQ